MKQITVDEWLRTLPANVHKAVEQDKATGWKEPPTCEQCDVDFGSLICFERRGYFYLRSKREFLKGSDGKPLITKKNIICKKLKGVDE